MTPEERAGEYAMRPYNGGIGRTINGDRYEGYLAGYRAAQEDQEIRIGQALATWFTAHMAELLMPQHWEQIVKIIEGEPPPESGGKG